MLGVFKRRWKSKKSANVSRLPDHPHDAPEKRAHQVHPARAAAKAMAAAGEPPPPHATQYSALAPSICVEAGRIQFVRQQGAGGRVTVARGQQTEAAEGPAFGELTKSLEQRIQELETLLEAVHKNELRDKQTIAKLQKQIARRESSQRDADRERRLRSDSESRAKSAIQDAARCRSRLKLLTTEFARMEETVRSMLAYKKQAEQLRQEKNALTLAFENRCQQYQNTIVRLNNEITALRQQLSQQQSGDDLSTSEDHLLNAHTAAALQRQAEESRKQYERCLDDVANQVVRALLAQKGLREEVGSLNLRIHELEAQNRALTSMLVHQLRGTNNNNKNNNNNNCIEQQQIVDFHSPDEIISSQIVKHNSISSELCDSPIGGGEDDDGGSELLETRLSLADKKRHHVLTKLWTELKGSEMTPRKLLEALSTVDSSLWVQPQRPVSLNLHLPFVHTKYRRARPILAQSCSKSEEETTGNDSPESSGNRDEGYSTMSSDVQADVTRDATQHASRNLEDLKEATDETESQQQTTTTTTTTSTTNDQSDIFYIPLNLINNLKPRNSFPPFKEMLPFQHLMRSFSDSHLCIKITTAPSPCSYTFTSPLSSTPSILFVDRRRRAKRPPDAYGSEEHIQRWLRLDETRSALELEYDRAELEDWSLSLSSDDLRDCMALTPGQLSVQTLPSIQENNALELEEDANECLWNNSSYMADREGRELITLLMDQRNVGAWPYAPVSPAGSWSSAGSEPATTCSKRSSTASDDQPTNDPPGVDFTRDFYRLVKFESTRSLASTSSREFGERESTLCNVLSFIAEQQKLGEVGGERAEGYVTLKQLCEEFTKKEQVRVAYAEEVCLGTPLDVEASENCSTMAIRPVDICASVNVELDVSVEELLKSENEVNLSSSLNDSTLTSSTVSTPDTIVSKIPRRKVNAKVGCTKQMNCTNDTKIPKICSLIGTNNCTKIPYKNVRRSLIDRPPKFDKIEVRNCNQHHVISSERLPQAAAGLISNIIDGPPHRAVSFHERATSKDVIDELNRMIKNENGVGGGGLENGGDLRLDEGCKPTGWVHVEKDIDLADPKARANLLDVMMASVSSDSSPTSSCGGSVGSDLPEDPPSDYGHLHRIHRFHRQKKANAARPEVAVVRASMAASRPTIIGRQDFYVRYGDKEKEAVASFDFLDEIGAIEELDAKKEEQQPDLGLIKVTQV